MPTAPSSVPSQPRRFSVSPPGSAVSMTATMMGIIAMMSEARPEATLVSPQMSSRLFTVIIRTPTSARRHAVWKGTRRPVPRARQKPQMMTVDPSERRAPTSGAARWRPAIWMAP